VKFMRFSALTVLGNVGRKSPVKRNLGDGIAAGTAIEVDVEAADVTTPATITIAILVQTRMAIVVPRDDVAQGGERRASRLCFSTKWGLLTIC